MLALALASGLYWTQVGSAQALVCPVSLLSLCLEELSPEVRRQLPDSESKILGAMGLRSAMVMPTSDAECAGLVLVNDNGDRTSLSVNLGGEGYSLPLTRQHELTLWHELGHLQNLALRGTVLPLELRPYQHEWLADIYLVWRSVHETGSLDLAWQQYHRRNLAVLADVTNMSHWSPPVLRQLLEKYDAGQLMGFGHYADFLKASYPLLRQYDADALGEFSSLIQRTFGPGAVQDLPRYIFWRKARLGYYLQPTLRALMGPNAADAWLTQAAMQPLSEQGAP
ncbi:hypothetical protein [Shewanella salipaludis]|uniref:hypothetical protein n=1 Tax=Shewanella salipaludis TaxID=2723052 RepID=UPI001FCF20BB|nr:hypothetical protein [Shewanella salipaludis]